MAAITAAVGTGISHEAGTSSTATRTGFKDHGFSLPLNLLQGDSTTDTTDTSKESPFLDIPESLVESFRQDGFVAIPSCLSRDSVDALNDRLEKILRGEYDRPQKPDKTPKLLKTSYQTGQFTATNTSSNTEGVGKEEKDKTKPSLPATKSSTIPNKNQNTKKQQQPPQQLAKGPLGFTGNLQNPKVLQVINVHKCDTLFRQLATSPLLGQLVARLAGWDGARLAQDQVWAKPPCASSLVFHRDSPYFMFDNPAVVTVWVALDTMDEELGPLEYVAGSHLWGEGRVGSSSQFFAGASHTHLLHSAALRQGIAPDDLQIISMAGLSAGGISIHNGRTWHGSGKNRSKTKPRRGLGLHFVPAQVRFTMEAQKSKVWKRYVADVEDAIDLETMELDEEDFPITWQP